jgi:hypothetical protein
MQFDSEVDFEIPQTPQNLNLTTFPIDFQIKTFIPKIIDKLTPPSKKQNESKKRHYFRILIVYNWKHF